MTFILLTQMEKKWTETHLMAKFGMSGVTESIDDAEVEAGIRRQR
jgi:hypothetical protein